MGKKRSNCLIFAIKKRSKENGFIVTRRSLHGGFPHFLWLADEYSCIIKPLKLTRFIREGGYLVLAFPKFYWLSVDDGDNLVQYQPKKPKSSILKYIHKLFFDGEIIIGDPKYKDKQRKKKKLN